MQTSKKINKKHDENLCRTCMSPISDTKQQCRTLNKECIYKLPSGREGVACIVKLLQLVQPQIKVQIKDGLPQIICLDCIQKLQVTYEFLEMYKDADKKFRIMVKERAPGNATNFKFMLSSDETLDFALNEDEESNEMFEKLDEELRTMKFEESKGSCETLEFVEEDNDVLLEMTKFQKEIDTINSELFRVDGEIDDNIGCKWSEFKDQLSIHELTEEELFDNSYNDPIDDDFVLVNESPNPISQKQIKADKKISRKTTFKKCKAVNKKNNASASDNISKNQTLAKNCNANNEISNKTSWKASHRNCKEDAKKNNDTDLNNTLSEILTDNETSTKANNKTAEDTAFNQKSSEKYNANNKINMEESRKISPRKNEVTDETELNNTFTKSQTIIKIDNETSPKNDQTDNTNSENYHSQNQKSFEKYNVGNKTNEKSRTIPSRKCKADKKIYNETDFNDNDSESQIDNQKTHKKSKSGDKINNETDSDDYFSQNQKSPDTCNTDIEKSKVNKKTDTNPDSSKNTTQKRNKKYIKNQMFSCTKCDAVLKNTKLWREHLHEHRLGIHKDIYTHKKEYKCEYCDKEFPRNYDYKVHLRRHSGEKPYLCSECGKGFVFQFAFNTHMLAHKGERRIKCPQCPKLFLCKSYLHGHMKSHNKEKEKTYSCDICGKTFHFGCQLKVHKLYHNSVKNFKCDYCDKRFVLAEKQRRHMRTHTGEKPYRCKYCERAFAQTNDCLKHMKKHVGDNLYLCDLCPLRFPLARDLRVHFNSHNNEDEDTRARNLEAREEAERNLIVK